MTIFARANVRHCMLLYVCNHQSRSSAENTFEIITHQNRYTIFQCSNSSTKHLHYLWCRFPGRIALLSKNLAKTLQRTVARYMRLISVQLGKFNMNQTQQDSDKDWGTITAATYARFMRVWSILWGKRTKHVTYAFPHMCATACPNQASSVFVIDCEPMTKAALEALVSWPST